MPTSAKPKRRRPAQEMFYLGDDHSRQDAELHDAILKDGDHDAAQAVSDKVRKRLGIERKEK
jgi:hypothetical protein